MLKKAPGNIFGQMALSKDEWSLGAYLRWDGVLVAALLSGKQIYQFDQQALNNSGYSASEYLCCQLEKVKKAVEKLLGNSPNTIHFVLPMGFSKHQQQELSTILAEKGIQLNFCSQAEAIYRAWRSGRQQPVATTTAVCLFGNSSFECRIFEEKKGGELCQLVRLSLPIEPSKQLLHRILHYWITINNIQAKDFLSNPGMKGQLQVVAKKAIQLLPEAHLFKEKISDWYNCQISIERFRLFLHPLVEQFDEQLRSCMPSDEIHQLLIGGGLGHVPFLAQQMASTFGLSPIPTRNNPSLYALGAAMAGLY